MILRVVLITYFLILYPFSCLHSCGGVRVCAEVPGGGALYGRECVPTCPGECPFYYLHWWDWRYCHQEVRRSDWRWRYEHVYTANVCMSFMLCFPPIADRDPVRTSEPDRRLWSKCESEGVYMFSTCS